MTRYLSFLMVISSFSVATLAQQPESVPKAAQEKQQSQPASGSQAQDRDEKQRGNGTSNDRLFFALPNFLTLETTDVPPLTSRDKFKVVAESSFDYVLYPWYGLLAGISQAENSEPGYGQGSAGYAKRYGAAFSDGTIESFMTGAIFPSLLHQDPRYFQLGQGSFIHRAGYSMSRIFVTRTDSGQTQINFSEILGSAVAAGVPTYSYHPKSDRKLTNASSVWATQVGYDMLTIVAKEFWPDIRRKLRKK